MEGRTLHQKCEMLRGRAHRDSMPTWQYLWEKFGRELKTTFGLSWHKPRDRFVQKIKSSKSGRQKNGAKKITIHIPEIDKSDQY